MMEHSTNPTARNTAVRWNAYGRKAAVYISTLVLIGVLVTGCSIPRRVTDAPSQGYVVRNGDTFDSIARRHRVSAFALKYYNKACRLSVGQRLIIRNFSSKDTPKDKLEWPVARGRLTSGFGALRSGGRRHKGIDIAASVGTSIYAAAPGCVSKIAFDRPGYGHYVILEHMRNQSTLYAHLASRSVSVHEDQFVENGQRIAKMGKTGNATGPHLHFEVRVNGKPRDPLAYLATDSDLRVERKHNQPLARAAEKGGRDGIGFAPDRSRKKLAVRHGARVGYLALSSSDQAERRITLR